MGNGWIKIYRKLREWEWYTDSQMVHLFIHLLLEANHEDRQWRGTIIKRGQLLTSRSKLSIETGISERSIRTCLERLKSTSQLTSQSTNRNTILTICNYDDYQAMENGSDQQNDQPAVQQTTSKRPTITQELKKNSIVVSDDTTKSKSCETSTQEAEENINFEKLIIFFNQTTNNVFGQVKKTISEKRKSLIRARVREHGKEAFAEMVNKASKSDFLKGENNRGWVATFDWMIKPNNFAKILEGNYDNRSNNGRQQKQQSTITDEQLLDEIRQGMERGIAENARRNT